MNMSFHIVPIYATCYKVLLTGLHWWFNLGLLWPLLGLIKNSIKKENHNILQGEIITYVSSNQKPEFQTVDQGKGQIDNSENLE